MSSLYGNTLWCGVGAGMGIILVAEMYFNPPIDYNGVEF